MLKEAARHPITRAVESRHDTRPTLLAQLERRGRRAVAAGDAGALRQAFEATAAAKDPHVRLAATLRIGSAVLDARSRALAAAFASSNLDALRAAPLEPAAWRLQARLLEATGAAGEARACEGAAARLERLDATAPEPAATGATSGHVAAASSTLAASVRAPEPGAERLSLAMIVKNEEAMLGGCLASVRDVVDEIVVVDTGSSDRTAEIAREFGAVIVDFPWIGDFAAARNAGLARVTGDWVLILDADERLEPEDGPLLRRLLAQPWRAALRQRLTNFTGEAGMSAPLEVPAIRVWRHTPHIRYEGHVHEQVVGLPAFCGERFQDTPVRLVHHGYSADVIRAANKRDRNLALLQAQLEAGGGLEDAFLHFNIGAEHLMRDEPRDAVAALERSLALTQATPSAPVERLAYGPRLVLRLARAHRLAGEPARGAEVAARWLPRFPGYTDLAVEQALCTADTGDNARGLALLDAALALGDGPLEYGSTPGLTTTVGSALRGEMLSRLGRHAEAVAAYRAGLAADPDYIAGLGRLAESLLATGKPADAVATELAPLARRHLRTGGPMVATALFEHGAVDLAQSLYAETLAAYPDALDARLGLAECALSHGDTAAAAAHCEPLPAAPAGASLARCAAFCALVDGDAARASDVIGRAAEAGIGDPELEAYGAWLLALRGEEAPRLGATAAHAALDALGTAVKLERLDAVDALYALVRGSALPEPETREELGQRFFAAGFTDIAADEWIGALDADGERPRALFGLAQVALTGELLEDARNLAAEAARLEPELPGATLLVQRLDELLALAAAPAGG
jgi:tetratricopeptide (TPR) repeat protein